MLETTDVRSPFSLTPEGTYTFTVIDTPIKKPTKSGKHIFFVFKFAYFIEGEKCTHTEYLMPWDLRPLLKALGFEEAKPGEFTWDRQECIGKSVQAKIVHQADKKDKEKIRARMVDIIASEQLSF